MVKKAIAPPRPSPKRGVLLPRSSCGYERMFVVGHAPCAPQPPCQSAAPMRELQCEDTGDRRVRVLAGPAGRSTVTIALRGPHGHATIAASSPIAIWHRTRQACATVSA